MASSRFMQPFLRLSLMAVTAVCLMLGASELRAGPIQWTVAEGGNGDWYELVMPDSDQYSYTWTQARAAADNMTWDGLQGYLATVTSPEGDGPPFGEG